VPIRFRPTRRKRRPASSLGTRNTPVMMSGGRRRGRAVRLLRGLRITKKL
jgi:hypothetical protein